MDGKELGSTYFHAMPDSVRFEYENNRLHGSVGITLRQHFAGLAMQGCLAYSYCNPQSGNYHENSDPAGVAKSAVSYADALLAELAKEN